MNKILQNIKQTYSNYGTRWTSRSIYVDIENGEQLKVKDAITSKYIKIKTLKNVILNKQRTRGIIEYTIECRRNPQTEFKFDGIQTNSGNTIHSSTT